ncbi:MAG: sigma-70 family RNA polymerase sigma factor [Chloroflexi bacterium]|nr:sigma-70 family RNA polymerase sigma factor [Ardenticatenaceae bacterium]MBL1130122.1 sigma-70 family RNA polymerase sigma factor [Chloroflexota bacterium]NOG36209.1 sigma-70 family RNA polymerase sigma factor [Chloroflexota bacterium]GIK56263.1 MAG: ECF RNA polymerase sigma factor SigW [Chloroflexota bacterium]
MAQGDDPATQNDEPALLRRAQQGDEMAFAELVRRHQTAVFNVAYRLFGRRQDAEDAAQEAFLRAYQALDRFDLSRPFAPWIKRITANLCLNWLESERVRPQVTADVSEQSTVWNDWAATVPTPEQTLLHREQASRLRNAILQLSPTYRAVIEYRHFQEMSYDEIAIVMARPVSSVKSDLFRARKLLAEYMQHHETGEK